MTGLTSGISKTFLLTALVIGVASTAAYAAKTAEELKKAGYSCEAISGGMECRKGKDDVKYLCDSTGKTCENYKIRTTVIKNRAVTVTPAVNALDTN